MATLAEIMGMSEEDINALTPGTEEYRQRMLASGNADAAEDLFRIAEKEDKKIKAENKAKATPFFINNEALSKFADPNYQPKTIMEQFADPKNVPMSPFEKAAKDRTTSDKLRSGRLELANIASDKRLDQGVDFLKKIALDKKEQARKEKLKKETMAAQAEANKFVPKDTVLGRIFDKRVKPGEEISNRDKAFAYIRNISDNLLERRLVGGKEGTDTLSRILGPGGGLEEGRLEVEALEDEAIALREKGETKAAAAIDTLLDRQKTAYEIKKIDSEAMKNIAEAAKTDYSKATQQAMELATIRGFAPGTAEYMAEVDAILSVAVTEGQASIIKDLADLQSQLSIMDPDSEEAKAMQDRISMLQRKSVGTTMDTDAYKLPEMTINPDGSLKTS